MEDNKFDGYIIGIDASSIKTGGGKTHLIEILAAADPLKHNIKKVILWVDNDIASQIEDFEWLDKVSPQFINSSLYKRFIWQLLLLPIAAKNKKVNLIIVAGGNICLFRPYVTIVQNLLPFEWNEILRYKISFMTIRLIILRVFQSISLIFSSGAIFITKGSKKIILNTLIRKDIPNVVIPHGVSRMFSYKAREIKGYNHEKAKKINLIYASTFDEYKHQIEVVKAVRNLRRRGYNIILTLVGNFYLPYLRKFEKYCFTIKDKDCWLRTYHSISYNEIVEFYDSADIGVWASSCEVFGMILLEMMANGLPIVSSNKEVMIEILGNSGYYFNPESPHEIATAIANLIDKPKLQVQFSEECKAKARSYSWDNCSYDTFSFCKQIIDKHLCKCSIKNK